MDNQTQTNQATGPKKESQPSYGDKPWQVPEENNRKESQSGDSCGCDSETGNKKDTTKRH